MIVFGGNPRHKAVWRNILRDNCSGCDHGIFAHYNATTYGGTCCNPNVLFNYDWLCLNVSPSLRRFQRVTCGYDVHVWPDHDLIGNVNAAHVIKRAALINGGMRTKVSSTFRPVNSLNISLTLVTTSKESLFSSAVNRMGRLMTLDAASPSGPWGGIRVAQNGLSG